MSFTTSLVSHHVLQAVIVAGGIIVLIALLILLVWIRMERRAIQSRYHEQIPTWSDAYRDSLAHRVKNPNRVASKEEAER